MARNATSKRLGPGAFIQRKTTDHLTPIKAIGVELQKAGINESIFNSSTYLKLGYMPKKVHSLLRLFDGMDTVKISTRLQLGVKFHFFQTPQAASASEFFGFLKFLRTKEGQDALRQLRHSKPAARTDSALSIQDLGYCAIFDVQKADVLEKEKYIRAALARDLEELQRQIKEVESTAAAKIKQLRAENLPYGSYVAPNDENLGRLCWAEYISKCTSERTEPVKLPVDSISNAVETFQDVVLKRHLSAWLRQEEPRAHLKHFCQSIMI